MARVTMDDLNNRLKFIARKLKMKTSQVRNKSKSAKNPYKNEALMFSQSYGRIQLVISHKSSGRSDVSQNLTKPEMDLFLRGMDKALSLKKK